MFGFHRHVRLSDLCTQYRGLPLYLYSRVLLAPGLRTEGGQLAPGLRTEGGQLAPGLRLEVLTAGRSRCSSMLTVFSFTESTDTSGNTRRVGRLSVVFIVLSFLLNVPQKTSCFLHPGLKSGLKGTDKPTVTGFCSQTYSHIHERNISSTQTWNII